MALYRAKTTIVLGGVTIPEGQTFEYDGVDHGTPDSNMELVKAEIEPEKTKAKKVEE